MNMLVLLLASFLSFLGVMLGLHCIIQCIFNLYWIIDSPNSTGLRSNEVNKIPVVVYYGEGDGSEGGLGKDCCICLVEFCDGDNLRAFPLCNHRFHVKCIDTCMFQHHTCPAFRFLICCPAPSPSIICSSWFLICQPFIRYLILEGVTQFHAQMILILIFL